MLAALPNPVLAVTHDVLSDIDGEDALSSLWFIFTKCKSALQEGRRLENISWRLWHRELSGMQPYRPPTPDSPADGILVTPFDNKATDTPSKGKDHPHAGASPPTTQSHIPRIGKLINDISMQTMTMEPRSHLPTPTTEAASITIFATAEDGPPRALTPPVAAATGFPRVIVVNPTPNPTPHPTPPATPVMPPTHSHPPLPNLTTQLPPPRVLPQPPSKPVSRPSATFISSAMTLKPSDIPSGAKFYTGSPSSSSTSDSSGSSSSQDSPPEEAAGASSNTTSADVPPSFSRSEALVHGEPNKVSHTSARRWATKRTAPRPGKHSQTASAKSLAAEDRELEEQQRSQQEQEKYRHEAEEKERLIAREREREWQRKREREREEEERRTAEAEKDSAQQRDKEAARQREFLRQQAEKEQLRRTASVGHLPAHDPTTAVFDLEDSSNEEKSGLQPSGSHPELARTVFGLNRALSPPKATNSTTKGKGREPNLLQQSSTNLQALAKERAAARVQSTLRGAFTPVKKSSPTKSELTKASTSSQHSQSPSTAQVPAPVSQASPKPAPVPSVKGKEKAANVNAGGKQIVLVDSDDDTISNDEEWTSADEDEDEDDEASQAPLPPPPPIRPKARSASPVRQPSRARQPAPPARTKTRRQMPPEMQKHLQMTDVKEAFDEAERQKELFTFPKLPKRSYSNLSRTNSGLLSQLMNPDMHDYRRGHSSGDLTEKLKSSRAPLHPSQSAAALPIAANVHVGSVRGGGVLRTVEREKEQQRDYRPKGRPQEEEMEDDDESDGEDDNSLPVSNSVAQEKLKAIFGNMRGGGGNADAKIVDPIRPPQHIVDQSPPGLRKDKLPLRVHTSDDIPTTSAAAPAPLERTMTEPVAVPPAFPYNLPIAALPVSPRTTRQWMLRTEMSESVRTNLLWQRQLDKQLMSAPRRNKSSNAISAITSVVKITEKKNAGDGSDNGMLLEQEREQSRHEIRRINLMRNKSWAADYHPQAET